MIYDVATGVFPPGRPDIYDADGVLIRRVVRLDTETGEIARYACDENGSVIFRDGGSVMIDETRPLPFRFEPRSKPEADTPYIVGG